MKNKLTAESIQTIIFKLQSSLSEIDLAIIENNISNLIEAKIRFEDQLLDYQISKHAAEDSLTTQNLLIIGDDILVNSSMILEEITYFIRSTFKVV